jgi:hypothetical protein
MVQNRHVLLKQNQSGAKSKAIICPFAVKLTYVAGLVAGSYEISLFVVCAIVLSLLE